MSELELKDLTVWTGMGGVKWWDRSWTIGRGGPDWDKRNWRTRILDLIGGSQR